MTQVKYFRWLFSSLFILIGSPVYADDAAAPATATAPAAGAPAAAMGTPVAQVIWVKGNVKATQGTNERVLQRRDPLYKADVITTDQTGTGEIAFTDSSVVTLREATEFKIDSYNYKPGGAAQDQSAVMSVVKGGFRTITGAIPKEHQEGYQVNTPVATIGVNGTDYSIFYSTEKGLVSKIDHGAITIKNQYGSIQLSQALNKIYASVPTANMSPQIMSKLVAEGYFSHQPTITPVPATTINSIATPTTPATPVNTIVPLTPGSTAPINRNPPKSVSSFCIGLLQDVYRKVIDLFS